MRTKRKAKEESFERKYCERSDISIDEYRKHFVTLPCSCISPECDGWAVVNNDELSINTHNNLYR